MSPRDREGLAAALEALDRERMRHSVLSEAFYELTLLRERLAVRLRERP